MSSLIIYTHNSETQLKKTLFYYTQQFNDIIIVDDSSDDETAIYVQTHFKQCRVIQNPYFIGYAASVNYAIESTSADWITIVHADTQIKMLPTLDFCANVAVIVPNNTNILFSFKAGRRSCSLASRLSSAICINKAKFIHCGGLDRLYYPGGYEWADFIYQIQQRSWVVKVDSNWQIDNQSELINYWHSYHNHRQLLLLKNELLFTWKNTDSYLEWLVHGLVMFISLFVFRIKLLRSFFYALGQWGPLFHSRRSRLPIISS